MKEEDLILCKSIEEGNIQSLSELYDQYVDALYSYGMKLSKNSHLVKDTIHDFFLDIYKYRKNLSKISNLEAYMFVSYKRKLFNAIRIDDKKNKWPTVDYKNLPVNEQVDPVEIKILQDEKNVEIVKKLSQAIHTLPIKQREIIFFKFYQDKDYDQIADLMDINVASARTLVYRAVKALKLKLKKD